MSLSKKQHVTLDEFYKMRETTEQVMEYIDGAVFMAPSPSTQHQRISGRLHAQLFQLLSQTDCEVFHAPFDVVLKNEQMDDTAIVVPDLTVVCDQSGLNERNYTGIPTLIIEIVSPPNQSHDLIYKLNLYMQYGVQEYWIVNPILNTVQLYTLDDNKQYRLEDVAKDTGVIRSTVFQVFQVDIESIFA